MNKTSKLVSVGNSTGIIIPRDVLAASGFAPGEEVTIKASAGRLEIEAKTDDFDRQMEIARDVMKRRFRALRELAK
ncbi:MAG: AbrB/MazE/SpoVT family DNA-binding domain-containing protein [Pseudomonadota bacterium]